MPSSRTWPAALDFDVLSGDADPTDPLYQGGNLGHGTATASVLVSPKTHVVSGTAPRARHMLIRAIESVIRITQVSVARAIDCAVEHDAHVIIMSLGGIPSFAISSVPHYPVLDGTPGRGPMTQVRCSFAMPCVVVNLGSMDMGMC